MQIVQTAVNIILHLDKNLTSFVAQYGALTYAAMFVILFAETGFVITPFLPGDSLLFAAGTLAAQGSLNVAVIIALLCLAAIFGDTINYWIGHFLGKKIVDNPKIRFINQEHIDKTEAFYKKYGGKTIILARFVPIVRTFAPFVAGVGTMHYGKFIMFNIVGGILWVSLLTLAGYFFGNIPVIKENFHYAVLAIIVISLLPMLYEYIQHKRASRTVSLPVEKLHKVINK